MTWNSDAMSPVRLVRRTSLEPHLGQRRIQITDSACVGSQPVAGRLKVFIIPVTA